MSRTIYGVQPFEESHVGLSFWNFLQIAEIGEGSTPAVLGANPLEARGALKLTLTVGFEGLLSSLQEQTEC